MSDRSKPYESSSMFDLCQDGVFCDAVIRAEDVDFQVHRLILSQCSQYFENLFRRWSSKDHTVFIPGLSADMMQLIIKFAYTGSVSVTEENVQELLLAANQLSVMGVVQICSDFLEERLCPDNCIGIWQLRNTCFLPKVQDKAYRCILDHFEKVVFCEEFLQLSVQELTEIIDRDDLNVRKETTVYEAILCWIAHVPEERKGHIAVLLSKVRLVLMSKDYIKTSVMSNELVKENPECQRIIAEADGARHRNKTNSRSVSDLCNRLNHPRLPTNILLAIGGWSGNVPTSHIEAYDGPINYWISVPNNHERPRAYHGTAVLNGSVYCVGGFNRAENFNSVRRLDLGSRTWHDVSCMHFRRCYVSVTLLNGCIYAMGGYDGQSRLNSAECYRPGINQWDLIAPMHEHRSDASCTTLNNKVYICGGFNGTECLQTAECYSPETNQWTMITQMSCRRSGIGVIAHTDFVYAVGGFDGTNRLSSAEVYNPWDNTWQDVSPMKTPRSNFGIEVLEDKIFVVGGFNGFSTTYNVEYYNPASNEWTEACDMEIYRSALSCCVVSRLPDMAEFFVSRDTLPDLYLENPESWEPVDSEEVEEHP